MANLFGFNFGKKQKEDPIDHSVRLPVEEADGTTTVNASGTAMSYAMGIDPSWRSEADMIQYYREMAMTHSIDKAVDEIVSDAIVTDGGQPVRVDFENDTQISDKIKKRISTEFDGILKLMNFKEDGHTLFRDWYVDGRSALFKVVDPTNTKAGILELQKLDVINLRKVKEVQTEKQGEHEVVIGAIEYYIYAGSMDTIHSNNQMVRREMRIKSDAIAYATAGLVDKKNNWNLSYLNKAIRPYNHLRLLEDAALIYKLVRAPQRRVFYVDVGTMPRARAEEYMRDIMAQYRNKITYDATTGDVKDDRRAMSMLEDYWLARREGCFSLDTKIKLLDGRDVELGQLIVEHKLGKVNWVYSVAPDGKVVPGMISWAGVTRNDAEVLDVYLDNGEVITATPDHKFILRNGEKIEAKDLVPGSSLMSPEKTVESSEFSVDTTSDMDKFNTSCKSMWNELKFERGGYDTPSADTTRTKSEDISVLKVVRRTDTMDVGTLTIDEHHIHHDYHNFALSSGIFVMNSKGTEISNLNGDVSQTIEDLNYFRRNLYDSLNIPVGRLEPSASFSLGRASEITRDELRMSSMVNKLRNRFAGLFYDILRTQLILKGVITPQEWDDISHDIQFIFSTNVLFAEMKASEILQQRLGNLSNIEQYIGRYFSQRWVQKNVLYMTDEEILIQKDEIDKEIAEGAYPDPKLLMTPDDMAPNDDAVAQGNWKGGNPDNPRT